MNAVAMGQEWLTAGQGPWNETDVALDSHRRVMTELLPSC
jgi:hypothetical protein